MTILVDTREQKPLPIPQTILWAPAGCDSKRIHIRTEPQDLNAGDYMLKEAGSICIVERKGNINEIRENLQGRDRPRAMRAFDKLVRATENPVLALDFPITQSLYKGVVDEVYTRLAQLCASHRLQILGPVGGGINARKRLSDLVIRVLLAYHFNRKESVCQSSPPNLNLSPTFPSST